MERAVCLEISSGAPERDITSDYLDYIGLVLYLF